MAYTVLARKYRSWTFDELVGQEAVATTLKNAITSGRIHHGYLFCGTRGVGKTSAARILARALNCLNSDGPTVTPCCKCESCLAIAEGQDVDVIEIDAASHTGVDDIRELRGNTAYRPARARYKVYIIDEVHMLSTSAFNALLKTLEEPPGHVKFILATTEPQKVPATIHSRCQRFDFRAISIEKIAAHFEWILEQEKIKADEGVVHRIARLARGSMRDGLSVLDQLLSGGGDRLTLEMVDDILPTPHDETLLKLVEQLADRDSAGALLTVDECLASGYSLERFAEALAEQVRALMLLRVCGSETPLVEVPSQARPKMLALAGRLEPEACVYMITVLDELRRNVRFSALGRALAEAAIVRLAGMAAYPSIQKVLDQLASGGGGSAVTPPGGSSAGSPPARQRPAAPEKRPASPSAVPARPAPPSQPEATAPLPEPAPETPRPTAKPRLSRSANAEELNQVRAEPVVREVMDLFGGTLVNVERSADPTPDETSNDPSDAQDQDQE